MKNRSTLLVGVGTLAILAAVGGLLYQRARTSPLGDLVSGGLTIPLGVETLVEDPHRYQGELEVAGIVARIASEQRLFALADVSDREEVLKTGGTKCVMLPVRWTGPMPALHDDVKVRGTVEESQGRLIFVASALNKPRRDPIPGGPR